MWELKNPNCGDQIRVNRGLYYHHGIYASEERVYHFASLSDTETSAESARVICTTLKEFLKGGNVEVRSYTAEELARKRTAEDIIAYAEAHLGEGGYNLLSNNCEHFSNRCAFGVSDSRQVEEILSMFAGLFR